MNISRAIVDDFSFSPQRYILKGKEKHQRVNNYRKKGKKYLAVRAGSESDSSTLTYFVSHQ